MSCKFSDVFKFIKEIVSKRYGIHHPSKVLVRSEKFLAVVPVEGTKHLIFKKEEPKIGPLISKVPNAIEFNIKCIKYGPSLWIHAEALEKRYPVQYLNEDNSDRPEESNILDDVFKKMHIQKFMETLEVLKEVDRRDSSDKNEDSSNVLFKSSELKENLKELVNCMIGIHRPKEEVDKNLIERLEELKNKNGVGEDSNDNSEIQLRHTQDFCTKQKLLSESPDLMDCLKKYGIDNPEEERQMNDFIEQFPDTKEEKGEPRANERKVFSNKKNRIDKFSEVVEILKNLVKLKMEFDASVDDMETLEKVGDKKMRECERFLILVSEMEREKQTFTEQQKNEISPLISEILSEIKHYVLFHYIKCCFYREQYRKAKVKAVKRRKSLQYLIDGYFDCPVESTTLAEKFSENGILNLIEVLDSIKNEDYGMPDEYEFLDIDDDDSS